MKNLKMFAIAVMAFAVMAMGVHAAEPVTGITGLADRCTETDVDSTCTLTGTGTTTLAGNVADDLTIVSNKDHTVTIGTLRVKKNVTLTINGGYAITNSSTNLTLEEGSKLIITGTKTTGDDGIAYAISSTGGTIEVNKNAVLSIVKNDDKGIVGLSGTLLIKLDRATMEVNENGRNAMNGSVKVEATESKIFVKDNGLGGFNGALVLKDGSTLEATGNGYSGVTLTAGTNIEEGSKVIANGNLKGSDLLKPDRTPDKADVSLKGNIVLAGEIIADSVGPEKDFWSSNPGSVAAGMVQFTDSGILNAKSTKEVCDNTGSSVGGTCENPIAVTYGGDGVAIVGNTATVYGSAKAELPSDVTKVIVDKNSTGADLTVAPGTEVENKTSSKLFVKTTEGTIYEIDTKKSATLGVAAPDPEGQTPGEGQTGTEGSENQGNQGPTDNVKNPDTNDNILVYAGLGLVSLASVAFTTRKRED